MSTQLREVEPQNQSEFLYGMSIHTGAVGLLFAVGKFLENIYIQAPASTCLAVFTSYTVSYFLEKAISLDHTTENKYYFLATKVVKYALPLLTGLLLHWALLGFIEPISTVLLVIGIPFLTYAHIDKTSPNFRHFDFNI